MDPSTAIELIEELLDLSARKSAHLDPEVERSHVALYADQGHFQQEMTQVFRQNPQIACHSSELPEPGSFLRSELSGQPVLLTRDRDGQAHAFLNVCRHRGARLVEAQSGCKHVFSCPYHAWTWSNTGDLRGIPHQKQGFPDIDKSKHGLVRLTAREQNGWLWVVPDPAARIDLQAYLDPIAADLAWLQGETLEIKQADTITCAANWKILIEGGIEAYHFQVAHAKTIGPYFPDNLSSYRMLGPHMRSVLPKLSFAEYRDQPRENWDIRTHTHLVYTFFPISQFLVQRDHIVWIALDPVSAGETRLRLCTLAPKADTGRDAHWARNHQITLATLAEDFDVGASIQAGLASGANTHLTFGRFEGALHAFAQQVQTALQT